MSYWANAELSLAVVNVKRFHEVTRTLFVRLIDQFWMELNDLERLRTEGRMKNVLCFVLVQFKDQLQEVLAGIREENYGRLHELQRYLVGELLDVAKAPAERRSRASLIQKHLERFAVEAGFVEKMGGHFLNPTLPPPLPSTR